MRVSLITTGIMELNGLAAALRRLFPDHDFHVEPDAPGKPFNGFTSCRVLPLSSADPPGKAVAMLRAALGTLLAADAMTPASDFAVILEDLELCNRGAGSGPEERGVRADGGTLCEKVLRGHTRGLRNTVHP